MNCGGKSEGECAESWFELAPWELWVAAKSCLQMVNQCFRKLLGREQEGRIPGVVAAEEKAPLGGSCC